MAMAGQKPPLLLPDVKAIVAVASGKGGVGKSTVAVNLAVSLARAGHRIGLLDADIYGPSLPRMLGLSRKPEVRQEKMIPLQAWGLSCMSIGFLVDEETAMIWRGPMVMGALEQMMGQVEWGPLDILVVDMPPGTGRARSSRCTGPATMPGATPRPANRLAAWQAEMEDVGGAARRLAWAGAWLQHRLHRAARGHHHRVPAYYGAGTCRIDYGAARRTRWPGRTRGRTGPIARD